jgi:hypothetical protein
MFVGLRFVHNRLAVILSVVQIGNLAFRLSGDLSLYLIEQLGLSTSSIDDFDITIRIQSDTQITSLLTGVARVSLASLISDIALRIDLSLNCSNEFSSVATYLFASHFWSGIQLDTDIGSALNNASFAILWH